jgi:hypothetical protein
MSAEDVTSFVTTNVVERADAPRASLGRRSEEPDSLEAAGITDKTAADHRSAATKAAADAAVASVNRRVGRR